MLRIPGMSPKIPPPLPCDRVELGLYLVIDPLLGTRTDRLVLLGLDFGYGTIRFSIEVPSFAQAVTT